MPTYELSCNGCGKKSDRFLPRILKDEDRSCPLCGSRDVGVGVGGGLLGFKSTPGGDAGGGCGTRRFI